MKIIWSETSKADLSNIHDYISEDSKYYAGNFVLKIVKSVEKIIDFPEIGRVVPEFNTKNIREIFVKNYRIIYRLENDKIFIVTVIHGSRLLKKTVKNPWEIE